MYICTWWFRQCTNFKIKKITSLYNIVYFVNIFILINQFQNIPDRDQNRLDKLREIYSPCNAYSNYRNLPKSSRCIPFIGTVFIGNFLMYYIF